jgi:hypothetical protein
MDIGGDAVVQRHDRIYFAMDLDVHEVSQQVFEKMHAVQKDKIDLASQKQGRILFGEKSIARYLKQHASRFSTHYVAVHLKTWIDSQ